MLSSLKKGDIIDDVNDTFYANIGIFHRFNDGALAIWREYYKAGDSALYWIETEDAVIQCTSFRNRVKRVSKR